MYFLQKNILDVADVLFSGILQDVFSLGFFFPPDDVHSQGAWDLSYFIGASVFFSLYSIDLAISTLCLLSAFLEGWGKREENLLYSVFRYLVYSLALKMSLIVL